MPQMRLWRKLGPTSTTVSPFYLELPSWWANFCQCHLHLSMLLSSMWHHSHDLAVSLCPVLRPFPKSQKKSLNDSNNYRAIASSSIYAPQNLGQCHPITKHANFLYTSVPYNLVLSRSTVLHSALLSRMKLSSPTVIGMHPFLSPCLIHLKLLIMSGILSCSLFCVICKMCPMLMKRLLSMYSNQYISTGLHLPCPTILLLSINDQRSHTQSNLSLMVDV